MDLVENESSGWLLVTAFALVELAALVLVIYLGRLRRRRRLRGTIVGPVSAAFQGDPKWVSREVERLCSGDDPNPRLIKQMSAEDRALFEVSLIDALNSGTREARHRLRSALVKYGYDEQCSRRVMSDDFSDRTRAIALLNLLRPQWRETMDTEQRGGEEGKLKARAVGRTTGPLDVE